MGWTPGGGSSGGGGGAALAPLDMAESFSVQEGAVAHHWEFNDAFATNGHANDLKLANDLTTVDSGGLYEQLKPGPSYGTTDAAGALCGVVDGVSDFLNATADHGPDADTSWSVVSNLAILEDFATTEKALMGWSKVTVLPSAGWFGVTVGQSSVGSPGTFLRFEKANQALLADVDVALALAGRRWIQLLFQVDAVNDLFECYLNGRKVISVAHTPEDLSSLRWHMGTLRGSGVTKPGLRTAWGQTLVMTGATSLFDEDEAVTFWNGGFGTFRAIPS